MEKLSERFIKKNTMSRLVHSLDLMELTDVETLMEIVRLETQLEYEDFPYAEEKVNGRLKEIAKEHNL